VSIASSLEANLREHVRERLPLITELIVDDVRSRMSRRTGASADSVAADPWIESGTTFSTVVSAGRGLPNPDIVSYQEYGTGIYGPEGHRITPRNAKVLAFDWPAAGGIVFAKSVAGMPGQHFFYGEGGTLMNERFQAATLAAFA
jgi:hypothetical protein